MSGTVNAPWCSNFTAGRGNLIIFVGPPPNSQISQSGSIFPFCDANGVTLRSPIIFGPNTVPIYICPQLPPGPYPFDANPCAIAMTKTVTVT
jgi:hypothetical protein